MLKIFIIDENKSDTPYGQKNIVSIPVSNKINDFLIIPV